MIRFSAKAMIIIIIQLHYFMLILIIPILRRQLGPADHYFKFITFAFMQFIQLIITINYPLIDLAAHPPSY
jgi:hypothetical protein